MTENPILIRELRRMQVWQGRWSPSLTLALPLVVGAVLLPALVAFTRLTPTQGTNLALMTTLGVYVVATPMVTLAVLWGWQRDRQGGLMAEIQTTLLPAWKIETGRIWAMTLPLSAAFLVWAVSVAVMASSWNREGSALFWDIVLPLAAWALFTSHIHFTALMALGGVSDQPVRAWAAIGVTLVCSLGLDLLILGLILKPVFLLLQLVDPASAKVLRSSPPPQTPPHG